MEKFVKGSLFGAATIVATTVAGTADAQILGSSYSYTGPSQGLIEDFNGSVTDLTVGHLDPNLATFDDTAAAGTGVSGTKWSVIAGSGGSPGGEFATSLRNNWDAPYNGSTWAFTERGYAQGAPSLAPGATGAAPAGDYSIGTYRNQQQTGQSERVTARFTNDTGSALDSLSMFADLEVSHQRGQGDSFLGQVLLEVSADNATWTLLDTFGSGGNTGLIPNANIVAAQTAIGGGTGRGFYSDAEMDAHGLAARGLGGAYDVSALGIGVGDDFYVRWSVPDTEAKKVQFGIDNVTTVPEPASFALISLGALAMVRRRKA